MSLGGSPLQVATFASAGSCTDRSTSRTVRFGWSVLEGDRRELERARGLGKSRSHPTLLRVLLTLCTNLPTICTSLLAGGSVLLTPH